MSKTTGNRGAFLDAIAWAEIGPALLAASDDGYNVLVGGKLFTGYQDHPRQLVRLSATLSSTAAGRYQLLSRYFDPYAKQLRLQSFGPAEQDAIALQQIKEQRALPDVDAGRFDLAVAKVRNIWASLPGAGYGQHEHEIGPLRVAFTRAGGMLA